MPDRELDMTVLMETLELAVPLWIEQLRPTRGEHPLRLQDARQLGELGASLMFSATSARGRANAELAFNALARGLASAAFAPGGITFRGRHWEVV